VRSSHGVYYWQAKIGGKSRRGSLRTKSQSVAKSRLSAAMAKARAKCAGAVAFGRDGAQLVTVAEWLGEWVRRQWERVGIRKATADDYEQKAGALIKSELGGEVVDKLTAERCLAWWRAEAARLSPVTANHRLRILKAALEIACEARGIGRSPAAGLERKAAVRAVRSMPSGDEVRALAETIRRQGKRFSEESADFVEFLAFSGVRPVEAVNVTSADISGDWLTVRGGEEGTKNGSERLVPINAALADLIERAGMRDRGGRLFTIKTPAHSFLNACGRLELGPWRVYDLRHYFGTSCLESGIDLATVADWMGHKDGGALLLKTYTHIRSVHSLAASKRISFA
jgi:integrase